MTASITAFMDTLHAGCRPIVESAVFNTIMSLIILINPIALLPQAYAAVTGPSVQGISLTTWSLFAVIQCAFTFNGIKTRSASVFFSMGISLFISLAIIATVLIRS